MNILLILCLILFGVDIGMIVMYLIYGSLLNDYRMRTKTYHEEYLKNSYINSSIKDYVIKQQKMLKNKSNTALTKEDYLIAGKYWGYKDTEFKMRLFEQQVDEFLKD